MKCKIEENNNFFSIIMEPETPGEVAQLVRLGMNNTKRAPRILTSAYKDGSFISFVNIGNRKDPSPYIPKNNRRV